MKIAYLSTYQPRECGLATFNANLIKAIDHHIPFTQGSFVIALNDANEYNYNQNVRYTIRQDNIEDYEEAASLINQSGADICCIQHEFGIYGGESGAYLLSLTKSLTIPFVVIFHTVLEQPDATKSMIVKTLAKKAERVVVMSRKAVQLLSQIYGIARSKIQVIPHGVPDLSPQDRTFLIEDSQLRGKKILLTFGLISPNKGLETVIEALPDLCIAHPDIVYIVLGKTHPSVERLHGQAYRDSLQQLARQLNVDKHLLFISDFVSEKELYSYLTTCDLYITPYLHEEQITSGTLSYAVGAGAAVLSTPYWHAKELLEGGRGRFFDFKNAKQLAELATELLSHPRQTNEIKDRAYAHGLTLRWPVIGHAYAELFYSCVKNNKLLSNKSRNIEEVVEIPHPDFKHLLRLTDDTGILQHCRYGIPNRKEGYCLDDNARALIAVLMAGKTLEKQEMNRLAATYLAFIQYMQRPDGNFHNFLDYSRQYLDPVGSEDSFGRTIWALGLLMSYRDIHPSFKALAFELFSNAVPHFHKLTHLRGVANTLIGISYFRTAYPQQYHIMEESNRQVNLLKKAYHDTSDGEWHWFEDTLTYDNGILPLSLLHACESGSDEESRYIALEAIDFLHKKTMNRGYLTPVGNKGWYKKGADKPLYDQQAIDAMAMVLLYSKAHRVTGSKIYQDHMMIAFRWFLGMNSMGIPLYDSETGGCYDGLSESGTNLNQGAESTLAYFISYSTVSASRHDIRTAPLETMLDNLSRDESVAPLRQSLRKGIRSTG